MEELISVIIPIYNVENYLKECVDSVINQTYKNLEIILVDDGSPDSCGKICDEYAKKDNRIKVIHKENGGLSDARNCGIDISVGKYLCFIDSDDIIHRSYIEILYNLCVKYNCKISQCDYKNFWKNEEILQIDDKKINENKVDSRKMIEDIYGDGCVRNVIAVNKLYDKELFDNIRYTVGKIHEDESTTYKLFLKCTEVACTNQVLYYYRQRENSITTEKFSIKRLDYIDALEERMEILKEEKETKLYSITLKVYCYRLLEFYYKCKNYIPNEKKIRNDLLKKYRSKVKEVLNNCNLKCKTKAIICAMYFFPKLYIILF